MRIRHLELHRIEIPFRASFKHASAERSETQSVWVEARSESGRIGYGESCPRSYVTGEDLDSVRAFFFRHRSSLLGEVTGLEGVRRFMNARRREIDENPAAWCAVELALLDLLAKEAGRSVDALLGLPELAGTFRYSAVIGDGEIDAFRATFDRYHAFGFTDYKLKLSGDLDRDRAKLDWIRREGARRPRVRLDANNLWRSSEQATAYLRALDFPLFAIEEPLAPEGRGELAAIARACGTRVILDESCLRAEQIEGLEGPPQRWVVNLRVSKMGGLLRSLAVVDAARKKGIALVVGAQVGETSLLSRAALSVANRARDLLVGQEGAFGSFLLTADVCDPPLMFGRGGVLEAPPAAAPGFGVDVKAGLPFLSALGPAGAERSVGR